MAIFKSPLRDNTSQRQQEKKHVRFACLHMSKSHARPHTISLTKRRRQRLTHSSHFELLVINSRHNFPFLSKHSQFIISLTSHYIGTFLSESGPCWWDCKRWFPRFYRNDATVLLFYSKMPEHGYVLAVKGCAWMNTPRVSWECLWSDSRYYNNLSLSLNLSGHSALNSLINRMLLSAFTGWVLFSYCFLEPKPKLILCPGAHKPRFETDLGEERLFMACLYTNLM